jgi:hypothetical protein
MASRHVLCPSRRGQGSAAHLEVDALPPASCRIVAKRDRTNAAFGARRQRSARRDVKAADATIAPRVPGH